MYHQANLQSPTAQPRNRGPEQYQLLIRQQPEKARVVLKDKEKDRKPLDPPPIIQLHVWNQTDPNRHFLHNPYLWVSVVLEDDKGQPKVAREGASAKLLGSVVSSLHRLKDPENGGSEGGFFVFGDISLQTLGKHRLRMTLHEFEPTSMQAHVLAEIHTQYFEVLSPRDWEGPAESTSLSRAFVDQGVRLRLRKEPRTGARQRQMAINRPPPPPLSGTGPPTPLAPMNHPGHGFASQPGHDDPSGGDEPSAKRQRTQSSSSYSTQYTGPPSSQPYPQGPYPAYPGQPSQSRYTQYPDPSMGAMYPGYANAYPAQTPTRPGQAQRPQGGNFQQPYSPGGQMAGPQYHFTQQMQPGGQPGLAGRGQQYGYGSYYEPYPAVATSGSTPVNMPYAAAQENFQYRPSANSPTYAPYRSGAPPQSTHSSQPTTPSLPSTGQPGAAAGGYQQPRDPNSTHLPPIQKTADGDAAVASVETESQHQQPPPAQDRYASGATTVGHY